VPFVRSVPINDSFISVAKAIDLFLMAVPDEGLIVVADCWVSPGDVVGVEGTHQ